MDKSNNRRNPNNRAGDTPYYYNTASRKGINPQNSQLIKPTDHRISNKNIDNRSYSENRKYPTSYRANRDQEYQNNNDPLLAQSQSTWQNPESDKN